MIKKMCVLLVLIFATSVNVSYAKTEDNPFAEELTSQELQALQQRTYINVDSDKLMKAIINVLQDNYYFIENADSRIGFILTSKEFDNKDKHINIKDEFGCNKTMTILHRYATARTEADISVTPINKNTNVRISFRKKVINMYNVGNKVKDILDSEYYADFFSQLDKELKNNK